MIELSMKKGDSLRIWLRNGNVDEKVLDIHINRKGHVRFMKNKYIDVY